MSCNYGLECMSENPIFSSLRLSGRVWFLFVRQLYPNWASLWCQNGHVIFHSLGVILVFLVCCSKILQAGFLKQQAFFPVLEAEKSKVPADSILGEAPLPSHLDVSLHGRERKLAYFL